MANGFAAESVAATRRYSCGTAYDMFTAMGAAAFAGRTGAERRAAGQTMADAPRTDNRFGLTPQEAQVARQAGAGATNAEIASRLFVTTSTVEYHLSKVFRKLGVTSRRQLAGRALSEGLEGIPAPSHRDVSD